MTLGDVIKEYRTKNGMSMDAFARSSGLSKAYVSILERNHNPATNKPVFPSIVTFKCAALAMGIDLDELFELVDENQPVYIFNGGHYKGKKRIGDIVKPFESDKGVRIPSFKIDSDLYDNLVILAEENKRTLEDEIEWRLHESVEQDREDHIENS